MFGVDEGKGGVIGGDFLRMEKLEESAQRVDLAADRFGGVAVAANVIEIVLKMRSLDSGGLGDAMGGKIGFELREITTIGSNCSRGTFLFLEKNQEFF